jgi:riboflavin synthase
LRGKPARAHFYGQRRPWQRGQDGPCHHKCYGLRVFTGLVEAIGHIQARSQQPLGQRLLVKSEMGILAIGESVSVNGVCLTVNEVLPDGFFADVSAETLERSTLGRLAVGSAVNLERALRVGDRVGGHWMTGHVDAVVRWISTKKSGPSINVTLELPASLSAFLAPKGSVGIEGVSLTVNEVFDDRFTVMIIPHTRQATTLDRARPGDGVNLEVDILARYVVRALRHPHASENGQLENRGADIALQSALIRAGFVHDSK